MLFYMHDFIKWKIFLIGGGQFRERERERERRRNSKRKEREFVGAKGCHWVTWQGTTLSRKH